MGIEILEWGLSLGQEKQFLQSHQTLLCLVAPVCESIQIAFFSKFAASSNSQQPDITTTNSDGRRFVSIFIPSLSLPHYNLQHTKQHTPDDKRVYRQSFTFAFTDRDNHENFYNKTHIYTLLLSDSFRNK